MELNIEQIIKALEGCQTTSEMDCIDCPYRNKGNALYAGCVNSLVGDALSLIKQLTEENERLRSPRFIAYPDGTTELIPSVKSVRADTVREMQEMLTTFFTNDDTLKYNEVDADYINERIDQIAKEMQEQEVDNGREKAKC